MRDLLQAERGKKIVHKRLSTIFDNLQNQFKSTIKGTNNKATKTKEQKETEQKERGSPPSSTTYTTNCSNKKKKQKPTNNKEALYSI